MSHALKLYQSMILEHSRAPRGVGRVPNPTHSGEGFNPICGDRVLVTIQGVEGLISKICVEAQSCALCQASASVLVETLEGKSFGIASAMVRAFDDLIAEGRWEYGGPAAIFGVVRDFPARAKCVSLPWKACRDALKESRFKVGFNAESAVVDKVRGEG